MSKRSASKAGLRDKKRSKKLKTDPSAKNAYMPTELLEIILTSADAGTKSALFAACKRVYNLKKDQKLAMTILKSHARDWIQPRGLDCDYAHEASLAGWIMDNYEHYLKAHNTEGFEFPMGRDFATCFHSSYSEYQDMDKFDNLLLKCHLYTDQINGVFSAQCYQEMLLMYPTPHYQALSRLAPYHKYLISGKQSRMSNPLLPLHDPGVKNLLEPRSLNELELQLFDAYDSTNPDTPLAPAKIPRRSSPLIRNKKAFKRALNDKFKYDTWAKFIDWEEFFMVGGSVLNCLLQDPFEADSQDIDFFYIGSDYYDYRDAVKRFKEKLAKVATGKVREGDKDSPYVRTRIANVKGQELKFQFIWYDDEMPPDVILHIFDLDACQVGWDGKTVLGTPSFVQSLTTSTMINYKLVNNENDAKNFLPRTFKYLQRGFTLLTPKKFRKDILRQTEACEENKRDIKDGYTGFLLNNDSLQVCRHFVELVTGEPQVLEDPSEYEDDESDCE